ncbi:MAG: copper transporter [Actinomycetota bacterium]
MINLRYHIVSLIAVFLALALGVIAGTTVVDQGLVRNLRRLGNSLRDQQNALREQNSEFKREIALWDRFADALVPGLMQDRLKGKRVVLLVADGLKGETPGDVSDAIVTAGGIPSGRIEFSAKWRLDDRTSREQLALALRLPADAEVPDLLEAAASQIAARLVAPGDVRSEGDVIGSLVRSGFADVTGDAGRIFPSKGSLIVYMASGARAENPSPDEFVLPLLRAVAARVPTALAEPLSSVKSLAELVRQDRDLGARVVTVDHADTLPGLLALVSGLRDLAAGKRAVAYGVRRGASAIAPVPAPTPVPTGKA